MIIIDSESDARDVLEHIVIATRDEPRPIVLFTDDQTPSSMDAAIDAGVSAYIVAGLQAELGVVCYAAPGKRKPLRIVA